MEWYRFFAFLNDEFGSYMHITRPRTFIKMLPFTLIAIATTIIFKKLYGYNAKTNITSDKDDDTTLNDFLMKYGKLNLTKNHVNKTNSRLFVIKKKTGSLDSRSQLKELEKIKRELLKFSE